MGSGSKERLRNGVFGVLLAGARDGARAKIRKRRVGEVIPWGTFQSREPRNQSLVLLPNEFSEGERVTHDEMKNLWFVTTILPVFESPMLMIFLYSYRVYALGRNT